MKDDTLARLYFVEKLKSFEPEAILWRLPSPHEGTCVWFTEHTIFRRWQLESSSRGLWIWGRPGVGKTVMIKHALDYLRHSFGNRSAQQNVVAFFFCDDKDHLRKSCARLLCSLLHQLLSQSPQLLRYFDDDEMRQYNDTRINERQIDSHTSSNPFLWKCLSATFQRSNNIKFWILIDALDELESSSRKEVIDQFYKIMEEDLACRVKIVFSDRSTPDLRSAQEMCSTFELESQDTAHDVRQFISSRSRSLCQDESMPIED